VTRRAVRVTPELFLRLDEQLPAERGPRGEPTAAEFAASDLLIIVERFATLWDALPMPFAGRREYRDLILTTRLVPYASIRGQLAPDGAIELIDIDIDLYGLADPDSDESDE